MYDPGHERPYWVWLTEKGTDPMQAPETLDLTLQEGVETYITKILLPDVRRAFELRKTIQPFGVALATMQGNTHLARPRVVTVGAHGAGLRNTKRGLRQLCLKTRAVGAILVYLTETKPKEGMGTERELVFVQLEHKEFGDNVWHARITDGKLGPWVGPLALDAVLWEVARTTFLPQRWMH